ncbi:MAG: cytochrome c3 family protein [Deltaproteobacteria bacterium]|nr:cytochrome c3 family protein [Deltaproteobacteria bacterium]
MPTPRSFVVAAALLGSFLRPANVLALKILTPMSGSLVTQESVLVLGTAPRGTEISWTVQGTKHADKGVAKVDWGEVFEVFLLLDPGLNKIAVSDQYLEVFYDSGGLKAPPGFSAQKVHGGDISRCEDCHDAVTMELRDHGPPDVCLACHVVESQNPDDRTDPRQAGHFRAVGAACTRCHDVHVSKNSKFLRQDSVALCGTCHAPETRGATAHPAYEEGGCTACHDAHYSGYPNDVKEPLPGLCNHCHEQGAGIDPAKVHAPLKKRESCALCHDPHGTGETLLRYKPQDVCTACHNQVLTHGHKRELADCATCHDPHLAVGTGLLRADVPKQCRECHDSVGGGKTVHPALKQGCQACHSPHADDDVAVAKTLCGACHDTKTNRELASIHGDLNLPPGSCSTCHPAHASDLGKLVRANVHFPLTQGKCSVCHGGGDERSVKIETPAARCRMCHPFEREMRARGEKLHDPVASGECTTCHDPHMSGNRAFLRRSESETCRDCHEIAAADKGRKLHPPAATCTECHGAHGGSKPKFLTATGPALCLSCHDDPREGSGDLHPALDDGCLACHDPHAGFEPGYLKGASPRSACLACHDDPSAGQKVQHAALARGCQSCHAPHRSTIAKFLKVQGNALCRPCHPTLSDHHRASPAAAGRFPGVKQFPVDKGELLCLGCHSPHGSNEQGLYSKPKKVLCSACHPIRPGP